MGKGGDWGLPTDLWPPTVLRWQVGREGVGSAQSQHDGARALPQRPLLDARCTAKRAWTGRQLREREDYL